MARHGPGVIRTSRCVVGVVVGCVMAAGAMVPAGAAVSDADCEALLEVNVGQSASGGSEVQVLAAQAEELEATADNVSDKKLKKGLLRLADVYTEASEADNTSGASRVIVERAKDWTKGYKVYAKALTDCQMKALEGLP